jgi:hypothetical protein
MKFENVGFPVREPMLASGEVDAVFGFSFSVFMNLKPRRLPVDDIVLFTAIHLVRRRACSFASDKRGVLTLAVGTSVLTRTQTLFDGLVCACKQGEPNRSHRWPRAESEEFRMGACHA